MAFLSDMRGVAKDSFIYGLSSSLSRMVSLITAPIVTRILVPSDYGVIALIQFAMGFFVVLAGMNIGSGVAYYYYREKNKGEGREDVVLSSGLIVTAIFAACVAGMVATLADPIAAMLEIRADGVVSDYNLATFLRLSAAGLFFSLIVTSTQTILRLWRKPATFLRLECINITLGVAFVFLFIVWMRTGVIGMFWIGIIVPAIAMILGLYAVRRVVRPKFSIAILGAVFAYCLPQVPGVFVNWAQTQMGRGFVNYFSSLSELGLYSIAFSLASVFVIVVSAFRMAYDPYALSIMDRDDAKSIYAQAYGLYSAIFAVLAGGLGAFSRPIMLLLTPVGYHDAYFLVIFFVTATFYMGLNNILGTGIWISKKTSYTSYAQMVAFSVLIVLSFVLVPLYHGIGAAIAYMCATLAQSGAYYIFAQRLWPVPYDYWRTHRTMACVLVLCVVHNYLIRDFGFFTAVLSASLLSMIVLGMVWVVGISGENKILISRNVFLWFKSRGCNLCWPK